jgi:hypothetical protein
MGSNMAKVVRIFQGEKILSSLPLEGSKSVGPMPQICGM